MRIEDMILVSIDDHVIEPRDMFEGHVPDKYRELAAKLAGCDDVDGIKFLDRDSGLMVETRQPDAFYARLPGLTLSDGLAVREVYSEDDNLEAVFKYLVNR